MMTRGTTKSIVVFLCATLFQVQRHSADCSWILRVSRRHGFQLVGKRAHVEFPGAGRCSRISQALFTHFYEGMRCAEHAPRDPFHVLERRHGLAEIVECGVSVHVECLSVHFPHRERNCRIISESSTRHGHRFP